MRKVTITEITLKKDRDKLTDEDLIVLGEVFLVEDLARLFDCSSANISARINRARKRKEEVEHPLNKGRELIQAIDKIIERERDIQKAQPESRIPTIATLMNIAVYTPIDVIKDEHSSRKEKVMAAGEIRKCIETWNNVHKTYLENEAMNEIIGILTEILEEVSLPIKELFWNKVLNHQKFKFLIMVY